MYDALRKMTVLPADRMGLTNKGRLEEGCDADITIFNPETVCDQEDFLQLKKPVGIDYVIMDGEIVLKDGDIVNGRRGRFIPFR
jgi:formylmethanofuran dehydrogenase subunit A